MNDIKQWFYSLTLNDLHQYIIKLETENVRLVKELNTSSKMNSLLESIVKSTQNGYSVLRRIEINKKCECNEHQNTELRKTLNESISETNLLLNNLHQFLSLKDSDHGSDVDDVVDIVDDPDECPLPTPIRQTAYDRDPSAVSFSPLSSDYEPIESNAGSSGAERPPVDNRVPNTGFHTDYTPIESQSETKQSLELAQNLSKPKMIAFSPLASPMTVDQSTSSSSSSSAMMTSPTCANPVLSQDKVIHLPKKCSEFDLSLKPNLEQHLLTHINTTFTVQRAGRGRPAKNDPRILRVTDSDLNILRVNEALAGLPDGVISLSALEELRKTKFTGFGRYRCPWPDCGYTPHFLRDLRRHMFKHTGDKKYKCDLDGCDFVTVWKTSLLQHQRKKHNLTYSSNNRTAPTLNHNNNVNNTAIDSISATNTSN